LASGIKEETAAVILTIFREDTMTRTKYLEGAPLVKGEQREWSPTVKLILAFILGHLLGNYFAQMVIGL
jgi:hypothetical protein